MCQNWYAKNQQVVQDPLNELMFRVGPEIYTCDDDVCMKKLDDLELQGFRGPVYVEKIEKGEQQPCRAVNADRDIKVELRHSGGRHRIDTLIAGDTIRDLKQECIDTFELSGVTDIAQIVLKHKGRNCEDSKQLMDFRTQKGGILEAKFDMATKKK